jgi:hypothetical protein
MHALMPLLRFCLCEATGLLTPHVDTRGAATYTLHKQEHPLPLSGPVTRIIGTKLIGAMRWMYALAPLCCARLEPDTELLN